MKVELLVAIAAVVFGTQPVAAHVTYADQHRSVLAGLARSPNDVEISSSISPDYGFFDFEARAGGNPGDPVFALATQQSRLLPESVSYEASFGLARDTSITGAEVHTDLSVQMSILSATPATLRFNVSVPTTSPSRTLVRLLGPGVNFVRTGSADWSGSLQPGSYRLIIQCGGTNTFGIVHTVSAALELPGAGTLAIVPIVLLLNSRRRNGHCVLARQPQFAAPSKHVLPGDGGGW